MTPKIATGILSYTYMVNCSWKTGVPVTKHIAVYTQADEKYWPRIVGIVSKDKKKKGKKNGRVSRMSSGHVWPKYN